MAILCLNLPISSAQQPPPPAPTTTTLADGTKVTTNADGSRTSDYPDGSRSTKNADGSTTTEQTTKGADGQTTTTRTTYKPDGTRITEQPPAKPVEDQPVGTGRRDDGGVEYRYADGTVVKFKGNGVVEVEQLGPNGTTETIYRRDGSRRVKGPPGTTTQTAAPARPTNVSIALDNRPEQVFCVGGNPAAGAMDKFKVSLGYTPNFLGNMEGSGSMFTSKGSAQQIQQAMQQAGLQPCSDSIPELNLCTIMTPLTAFRGHDHEIHQDKNIHGHDAPDPPWSWGATPPEIVIRWEPVP